MLKWKYQKANEERCENWSVKLGLLKISITNVSGEYWLDVEFSKGSQRKEVSSYYKPFKSAEKALDFAEHVFIAGLKN